jgi:CRISPR/Cas system CSM-associated protein Csm2 small subunit
LLLSRALNRWAEAAQQLRVLRAKAQKVLQYMLLRRLRAAFNSWREAAAQLMVKKQQLATALLHWRKLLYVKAINMWIPFVQV